MIVDYVNGGELFTHLYQREKFSEDEVRIYIGEIVVALEHLHRVSIIKLFVQYSDVNSHLQNHELTNFRVFCFLFKNKKVEVNCHYLCFSIIFVKFVILFW